jgi:spore germination cell wall hydrolase CwlJ-like protein
MTIEMAENQQCEKCDHGPNGGGNQCLMLAQGVACHKGLGWSPIAFRPDDLVFLALAIWRESRGEPVACRVSVAHSVWNRVQRKSWWGDTVVNVLRKKWQYSSLTDPRDPQLTTWPQSGDQHWEECISIARDVLTKKSAHPMPGADSYHDISIAPPAWTAKARRCGQIGKIIFYDVDHDYQEAS